MGDGITTEYDHDGDQFRQRLRLIVDKLGGMKVFSEQADIPYQSVRQYLVRSDPTRSVLLKISTRLGINLDWLISGTGPINSAGSENAFFLEKDVNPTLFQDRLKQVAQGYGGIKGLASICGIPYGTMQKYVLKEGAKEPGRSNLEKICSTINVDARWLITGKVEGVLELDQLELLNATCFPKFSTEAYHEAIDQLDDTSDLKTLMDDSKSRVYSKTTFLPKELGNRIVESGRSNVAAFDFHDTRIPNDPLLLLVDLDQKKPKHGERALIMGQEDIYLMRAIATHYTGQLTFIDEATCHKLPDITFDELLKNDLILGAVIGQFSRR